MIFNEEQMLSINQFLQYFRQDMLLRTEKLVQRFFSKQIYIRRNFCQSQLGILSQELEKQKAELALEIYQLILKKPNGLNLKEKSLHDLIMEKIRPDVNKNVWNSTDFQSEISSKKQYHQEVKKPFLQMFNQGFIINSNIFNQIRIEDGKIQMNSMKKFIFHPTYLITSQVFQQLHRLQSSKKVLTGHYGISKTVSVCLFWHLVKFINDYRFKKGVKVSANMMRVPKIIYLSITENQKASSQNFKKFIIDQCPQMKEYFNITDGSLYNWEVSVSQFYQRFFPIQANFHIILVYDQINELAKIGRQYSQQIKELQKRQKNGETIQPQDIRNKRVAFFIKMKNQIQFFRNQINGTLYLSSMMLQRQFYFQIKLMPNENQRIPQINTVKFAEKIFNPDSLIQLINYFLFQLKERIYKLSSHKNISSRSQKYIKQYCFNYLNNQIRQDFFFTPVKIRELIMRLVSNEQLLEIDNQTKYIQETINIFKWMIQTSTELSIDQLVNHFPKNDKRDDDRLLLMMAIYNYLTAQKGKLVYNQNKIGVNLDSSYNEKFEPNISEIPVNAIPIDSQKIPDLIDKRLFSYFDRDPKLKLLLPSNLVIKALQPFTRKYLDTYLKITQQFLQKQGNGSYQGTILQNQIYFCLSKGSIFLQLKLKENQNKDKDLIIKFSFQQGAVYRYQSIQKTRNSSNQNFKKTKSRKITLNEKKPQQVKNKLYKQKKVTATSPQNPMLLTRFQHIFQNIAKKSNQDGIMFPVKKNYLKSLNRSVRIYQIHSTSKLVDIGFIKDIYGLNQKFIEIWLIDITIDESQIKRKIEDFIINYLKFDDRTLVNLSSNFGNRNINVNYFVLCPKSNIQSAEFAKELNQKFEDQIAFNQKKDSGYLNVRSLKNSNQCLLKNVGWIDIQNNVTMSSNDQQVKKQIKVYQRILKQILTARRNKN